MCGGCQKLLRTPVRVADLTAVLELQFLGICLHIQDLTEIGIGLGCARGIRTGDRLEMGQCCIQLGVFIELAYSLLLIRGNVEGGL